MEIALDNVISFDKAKERNKKQLNSESVQIVNKLFSWFYVMCPGFEKQFSSPEKLKCIKNEWYKAFTDENITEMDQLEFAFPKFRKESPINIPTIGQFLIWMNPTPEELGILPKEQAFNAAISYMRDKSSVTLSDLQLTLVRHAINESGAFFLSTESLENTQRVFFRNYAILIRDYRAGKLKPIPKAIEDHRAKFIEEEKKKTIAKDFIHLNAKECLSSIKSKLGFTRR